MKFLTIQLILTWALTALSLNAEAAPQVQITDLDDFDMGVYNGVFAHIDATDEVCAIKKGAPGDDYKMTFFGGTNPNRFKVFSGSQSLNFRVFYNDQTNLAGIERMFPGQAKVFQNSYRVSLFCNFQGPNGLIGIRFPRGNLASAMAGTYTGTVQVLMEDN